MAILKIPTPLRSYTDGQVEVTVGGEERRRGHEAPGRKVSDAEAALVQRRWDDCDRSSISSSARTTSRICREWKRRWMKTPA